MRLNQAISLLGIASRRRADSLIKSGRITVNHAPAQIGQLIDPQVDIIALDGNVFTYPTQVYYLLHKPKGFVSSSTAEHKLPPITNLVPKKPVVHPIGRLDADTTGLIILTNDGQLTYQLTHPKHHIPKTYQVTISGTPNAKQLHRLRIGIPLKHFVAQPAEVSVDATSPTQTQLSLTITEGKNHQIKRMMAALGFSVIALHRSQVGSLELQDLPVGEYRHLQQHEIVQLKKLATIGIIPKTQPHPPKDRKHNQPKKTK